MKQYKNYRYQPADDKNWLLEKQVEAIATKDTTHHRKGDTIYTWKFLGYFSNLEQLLTRLTDYITIDKFDQDLLRELKELKEYIRDGN